MDEENKTDIIIDGDTIREYFQKNVAPDDIYILTGSFFSTILQMICHLNEHDIDFELLCEHCGMEHIFHKVNNLVIAISKGYKIQIYTSHEDE